MRTKESDRDDIENRNTVGRLALVGELYHQVFGE